VTQDAEADPSPRCPRLVISHRSRGFDDVASRVLGFRLKQVPSKSRWVVVPLEISVAAVFKSRHDGI
jgi:hypothetical protein